MQLPLAQVKRSPKHVLPSTSHSFSSAPSVQSSSPSQYHVAGMQRWSGQRNEFGGHVLGRHSVMILMNDEH